MNGRCLFFLAFDAVARQLSSCIRAAFEPARTVAAGHSSLTLRSTYA
jgi:hypothetical protein